MEVLQTAMRLDLRESRIVVRLALRNLGDGQNCASRFWKVSRLFTLRASGNALTLLNVMRLLWGSYAPCPALGTC
jgi:hypothetical protein